MTGVFSPGTVLNGIYRIGNRVACGGTGTVYAGVNAETGDQVAIKIVAPHLTADARLLARIREDARLLTRVSYPAIVAYRVFAQDPVHNVHYIATDFVEGPTLSQGLDGQGAASASVVALLRRLAAGLHALHKAGAVHCDVASDNVMLPGGRIEAATLIDLGIAHAIQTGDASMALERIAARLDYVAPEQLGVECWPIGGWTDIYATALVGLAFLQGRPLDMGVTIAEAIARRRTVPPLDAVPEALRPLFEAMLRPAPLDRIGSMAAVLSALDVVDGGSAIPLLGMMSSSTEHPDVPALSNLSRPRAALAPAAAGECHTGTRVLTAGFAAPGAMVSPAAAVPRRLLSPVARQGARWAALGVTVLLSSSIEIARKVPSPPLFGTEHVLAGDPPAPARRQPVIHPPIPVGQHGGEAAPVLAAATVTSGPPLPRPDPARRPIRIAQAQPLRRHVSSPPLAIHPVRARRAPLPAMLALSSFCRRYDGKRWRDIGMVSAQDCLHRGFRNGGSYVQYGKDVVTVRNDRIGVTRRGSWMPVTLSGTPFVQADRPVEIRSAGPAFVTMVSVCRFFDGGQWRRLGTMSGRACIEQGFGQPGVGHVQAGQYLLSRRASKIGIQVGDNWQPVGRMLDAGIMRGQFVL